MLDTAALDQYRRDGFVLAEACLAPDEVAILRDEIDRLNDVDLPSRVFEQDGRTVRALHGCHLHSPLMQALTRLPRLTQAAQALVGGDVYVYQFKVNMKAAFTGDVWKWHQDYIYWRDEDGMPDCRVTNLALHLDDAHEANGALMVIPGSHREGLIEPSPDGRADDGSWRRDVSADLKYTLSHGDVARLAKAGGIRMITAPAGSLLAFHPNLAHASLPNLSPDGRRMLIVTYNHVANAPHQPTRPEFLVGRDTRPIVAAAHDRLELSVACP